MGAPQANWPRIWAKTKEVFVSQFLLISYIVATVIALAWPVPGRAVVSVSVRCRWLSQFVLPAEDAWMLQPRAAAAFACCARPPPHVACSTLALCAPCPIERSFR